MSNDSMGFRAPEPGTIYEMGRERLKGKRWGGGGIVTPLQLLLSRATPACGWPERTLLLEYIPARLPVIAAEALIRALSAALWTVMAFVPGP